MHYEIQAIWELLLFVSTKVKIMFLLWCCILITRRWRGCRKRIFVSFCTIPWIYTPVFCKTFLLLISGNTAEKIFKNIWYSNKKSSSNAEKKRPTKATIFVSARRPLKRISWCCVVTPLIHYRYANTYSITLSFKKLHLCNHTSALFCMCL